MKKTMLAVALGMCAFSAQAADPQPINLNVQVEGEVPVMDVFEAEPDGWASGETLELPAPDVEKWGKEDMDGASLSERHWRLKSSYGAIYASVRGIEPIEPKKGLYYLRSASGAPYVFALHQGSRRTARWLWMESTPVMLVPAGEAAKGYDAGFAVRQGGIFTGGLPYPSPGEYSASFSIVLETGIDEA